MNNLVKLVLVSGIASLLLGANVTQLRLEKSNLQRSGNDEKSEIGLMINSPDNAVFGLQFDINYDSDEINLNINENGNIISVNDLSSKLTQGGVSTAFSMKENKIKIVMFSWGDAINISSPLMYFIAEPTENYVGSSTVEIANIVISGKHGDLIEATSSPVEITFDDLQIPIKTGIAGNFPNPFNPSTQIDYSLADAGTVTIIVFDINGAEISILVSEHQEAGNYQIIWNGINNSGVAVASGRYLLKMTAPNFAETINMTLLK